MAVRYAFVTLLTSDPYLPGALTIAAALKDLRRSDQALEYETVCLVTPETLDVTTIKLLRRAFDVVVGVETIVPPDTQSLALLGRPDLDAVLTKLHAFRLTQYSKIIFLDADVLPLRPLSHLFRLDHEFSAVPDVGWPDIFNSGVMVLSPGQNKFKELRELLRTKGTWDGADQGLLNEWRGSNWNRLSFTYNTTPTAIYTYAPAYQRFGSQISAVHFIGPQKPWHSIPHRSCTQPTNMPAESSTGNLDAQQRPYDYASLVDCWYSVYDRHYRSQPVEPDVQFQPLRYASAWSKEGPPSSNSAGGALGLEALRRLALEGMGASGISVPPTHGEGKYRTMPLEGRLDLMRPRTRAERKWEQLANDPLEIPDSDSEPTPPPEPSTPIGQIPSLSSSSPVRWTTLPTPGIHEVPPAPHARLISLPPTPLHYVPAPYESLPSARDAGVQTESQRRTLGGEVLSPALLIWKPAIATPPNAATPSRTNVYFPKVWDLTRSSSSVSPSSSETSLTTMEPSPSKQPTPDALFSPPPVSAIPGMLRRQGQYRNVIGEGSGSPTPDPTKVKRVFPWEGRPRHAPERVFPGEASQSTAIPHLPVSATPERKVAWRSPLPSPLVGFPPSLQSHHPSDPQRYGSKFPRSAAPSSFLGFEATRESELDKLETSSQDGDIEDEVESEEEALKRSRMRSSSIGMAKHTLKYRSIGVQTDPRELREEGVQVTTFVPAPEMADKFITPKMMDKGLRRNWSASTGTSVLSAVSATGTPTSSSSLPTLDSLHSFSPSKSPDHPPSTALKAEEAGDRSVFSVSSRKNLNDPFMSSVPPLSPAGGQPLSRAHKGSRVWDPARGVEGFKRESEEILAKFSRMGSWEECA